MGKWDSEELKVIITGEEWYNMAKHFHLTIQDKSTNSISKDTYLQLKYKDRDEAFVEEQRKRIGYNYDLNMKYFDSLDFKKFDKYLLRFAKKYKFSEVKDLNEYRGIPGIYILVLDQFKQVYIGKTDRGITERIKEHWNHHMKSSHLIFGQTFNSKMSIDSFGPFDTTRVFVNTGGNLDSKEHTLINAFDERYHLNRTIGGIGSAVTYTNDALSATLAIAGNMFKRDFSAFINKEELYENCNSLDIRMYEGRGR